MIEVKHLTKKYASATAVNDVSFTVEPEKYMAFSDLTVQEKVRL